MHRKPGEEMTPVPSKALVQLIHDQHGHMSPRQRLEGAHALLARSRRGRHGVSVRSWATPALVVGVLALTAMTFLRGRLANSALSYVIDGGHLAKSGLVEADASSPPTLRFSDGTEVSLSPEAKVALGPVNGQGARVSVVQGSVRVDVVHRPGASWLFDAGPFLVAVTGTAFTVQWAPVDEQLDLKMERGTVEVSGPLSDGTISLRSGQHLVVRVRQQETLIQEGEGNGGAKSPRLESPPEPPAVVQVAASASSAPVSADSSPPPRQGAGERDWPAAVARGDYESVVRQAERRGLDASLSESSSADLAALADAARYDRRDDVARRALLAQRRRFPVSTAARDAPFLLGRLEETRRNFSGAVEWYDRYLSESPMATYASEALGRKMTLIQQLYGDERARPVAEAYLDRFPQGTYATRARALAVAP